MRQAFLVRYLAPSRRYPSRFKASCRSDSLVLLTDDRFSLEENATRAAEALQRRLRWPGKMAGGTLPDGSYAFVLLSAEPSQ